MAISMDVDGTLRLREVFTASFNIFRRHVVAFVILSAIAHIFSPIFEHFVVTHYPLFFWPFWSIVVLAVTEYICVLTAYGAIIYAVIQDLADRPVAMAEAATIAARRLSPLVGILAAGLVLIWLVTWMPLHSEFPGFIVVTGMFFVAAAVCIAEQVGIGAVLSRCLFLAKGHRRQIFVAILLVTIVSS